MCTRSSQMWWCSVALTVVYDYITCAVTAYKLVSHGFQCSPTLHRQPYEGRLPVTRWWRKSSNVTVGQSSLISLTHHCCDWHPVCRCGWTCNQLTSKVDGGITESRRRWSILTWVRPHNPATGFRPPSATVVSTEPFSHGTGTCGARSRKWRLTDTDLCPCGETQTMFQNTVESCPLTKLNGGLSRLHSADEDAVSWLTSYGS